MAIKLYGISTYNAQRVTLALLEFGVKFILVHGINIVLLISIIEL